MKLKGPYINSPEININGASPDININGPKINGNFGDMKIENPKINTDANLEIKLPKNNNRLDADINPGKVNIDIKMPDIKKEECDFYLEGIIKGAESINKKDEDDNDKEKQSTKLEINKKGNLDLNLKGSIVGMNQEEGLNLKGSRRLINNE